MTLFVVVFASLAFGANGSVRAEQAAKIWDVCFSPAGNCADVILSEISRAKRSIHVQAYSFTSREIAEALVAAKNRGVSVEVILDRSQPKARGGMFGFFLLPRLPVNYGEVMQTQASAFNQLFHGLLDRGVYIAPALYEAGFVSAAHTQADIDETVGAARAVFKAL